MSRVLERVEGATTGHGLVIRMIVIMMVNMGRRRMLIMGRVEVLTTVHGLVIRVIMGRSRMKYSS